MAATWAPGANRATNAPFTIFDGTVEEALVLVDQQVAPDDARPTPTDGELPTLASMPDPPGHHEVSDEDRAAEQAEKEEEQELLAEEEEAGADIRDENAKAEKAQRELQQTEGEL